MTYRECEYCGAYLDPGEICDCRTEETRLPAICCTQPPVIAENLDSVRNRLECLLSEVGGYQKNDESLKKVKQLRADLNKEKEQYESQRKEAKRIVLAPYEQANKKYEEYISGPYVSADRTLKEWVDDYQDGIKRKCEDVLRAYFDECCRGLGIDFLKFEDCGVVVDMATARQKEPWKAMDKIFDYVTAVKTDLDVISTLDDSIEVLSEYMRCKSLNAAIVEVNERTRTKEAAQSLIDQHSRLNEQQEQHRAELTAAMPEHPKEDIYSVAFLASGTLPALKAMKAHALSLGITLKEIKQEDKNDDE